MARPPDAVREQIERELEGPLRGLALDVEAVELTPAGKRRVLRVAVDGDNGVTLDDVAAATKTVSEVLDASAVMGEQPYTLEVTSRGVDRPLTLPRHWRRNAGRLVKVTLTSGEVFTGRIGDSTDSAVTLLLEGLLEGSTEGDAAGSRREVGYDDVTKALVQIEFNRKKAEEG
jgi:ribosome maturation factor RimP